MKILIVLVALSAILPLAAFAESADEESRYVYEEIVVTANFRETNLMDAPQSISAITSSLVEDLGAQSMEDVFTMIPGLNMQGALNGQSRYAIRGVSSQGGHLAYAPTGATVAVYIDGTPITSALGPDKQISGTFFDIERVEVLKGPQGTLFGEGSQGGTIRFLYKKPDPTQFDAAVNVGIAEMEQSDDMSTRIDAMVNVPISERSALRINGWTSETAGFIDNLDPFEEDYNDAYSTGVRVALRFEGDSFSVTGTIHHSEQETKGGLGTFQAYDALTARIPGFKPESLDEVDIFSLDFELDLGWATLHSLTSYTDRQVTSIAELSRGRVDLLDYFYGGSTLADPNDPSCISAAAFGLCPGFPGVFNLGGPRFTPDGLNLQAISNFGDSYSERWVQEFRLVSPSDQRVRWVAGLFWKDSEDHTQFQQVAGYFPGREAFGLAFDPLLTAPANTHTDFVEEYAVFGELSFDLTDDLEATVGVRVSDLEQEFTNTGTGTDDTPVSSKFALSWTPLDNLLIYASYTNGFRPGNVNNNLAFFVDQFEIQIENAMTNPALTDEQRAATVAGLQQNIADSRAKFFFDGDEVDNYELGLKTTFLDGRISVLAAGYHLDWDDMIIYVRDPAVAPQGALFNDNSGGAEIQGFELEVNAAIGDRLNLRIAGDINDSEVTDVGSPGQTGGDGAELTFAPNNSLSVALDYSLPVGDAWALDFHADHSWVADQYADSANTLEIEEYEKTNARITLRSTDQQWRIALFANNLQNEEILRGRDLTGVLYWHDPRQIGLEIGYQLPQ